MLQLPLSHIYIVFLCIRQVSGFFARVTIPVEKNEGGQLAAAAAEAATPKSREMGWIPR